ncbi:MAG: glycoside-pentoside-hexuronide (GPH):cation symporter [Pseudomonadota bacterium]
MTGQGLPKRLVIAWGLGTLPMAIYFNAFNILALRYLTDIVGLAAASAGLLISLSKLYDAVSDPVMGAISDKTKTASGRRRPYLLLGGLLCGLSIYGLFALPTLLPGVNPAWLVGGLLILYATTYTIYNVPYMAMPAEITTEAKDRSAMMSVRVMCIGAGGLIAGTLGPKIVSYAGGGAEGHQFMGLTLGVAIALLSVIIFMATQQKVQSPPPLAPRSTLSLREKAAAVAANRPFMLLLLLKLCILCGVAVSSATLAYFVVWVLGRTYADLGTVIMFTTLGQILGTPLWLKVAGKLGKRKTFVTSAIIFAGISMTWLLADSAEPLWLTSIRVFAKGLGTGGILLVSQAMLPDTVEYDRLRTGLAREGVLSGLYTTIEKISFALGTALTGLYLGAMNYVSRADSQPESAISAIYACQSTIPALFILLAAGVLMFYSLDDSVLEKLRRQSAPNPNPAAAV